MTLNITFKNGIKKEFPQVRMTTVFVQPIDDSCGCNHCEPQLVIHFSSHRPQENINLSKIDYVCSIDEVEQEIARKF